MTIEQLAKATTRESMEDLIETYNISVKHFHQEKVVRGSDYENLRFIESTFRNGFTYHHFLAENVGDKYGLIMMNGGSDKLIRLTDTKYIRITNLHDKAWFLYEKDDEFKLLLNEQIYEDTFNAYKVFTIGQRYNILKLETCEYTSCLIVNHKDVEEGYHIPRDEHDFVGYIISTIFNDSEDGYFDQYAVSAITNLIRRAEYEIFRDNKYKQLKITNKEEN
jgi:hypothetical protein